MMILADHYLYFRLSLTSTIRGAPSTWTGGKRWDSSLDLAKNYLVEYWILKFLDRSLNIHLLRILSLRNYVDFIYFAAGRRGANLGYCRSPGGQLRHVPVGAVRHSLRRHQEVPARLLRELLQRGPHQDPAHQRGQGALPPRQPSGRRHREFYWSIVSLLLCLCHFVFWNSIILTAASSSNFFGWKQTGASTCNYALRCS